MPVGMFMRWSGVTPEQYDEARRVVNWEGNTPDGALFHTATFDDGGARIFDVWESAEDFQAFVDGRLREGVEQAGIQGDPEVELVPTHAIFNPGIDRSG